MKTAERDEALRLRALGYSINEITKQLSVAKSSVSIWVREVQLTVDQQTRLLNSGHTIESIEKRRQSRLKNEGLKRALIIGDAKDSITDISYHELLLVGVMLYWAEGGKTQRLVRFSNGDPEMIKIIMTFFRRVCLVPESKFRGYIHIHQHLDFVQAEEYWSGVSKIPLDQFFKTYRKPNKSSLNKRKTLPYGTFDVYVMDANLFYKITGWAQGIFKSY